MFLAINARNFKIKFINFQISEIYYFDKEKTASKAVPKKSKLEPRLKIIFN